MKKQSRIFRTPAFKPNRKKKVSSRTNFNQQSVQFQIVKKVRKIREEIC